MQRFAHGTAVFVALAAFGSGCATDPQPEPLTWEEFEAQAWREPGTGIYVVNGDEFAVDADELRLVYDRYLASFHASGHASGPIASSHQPLAVNLVGGADDRWSASQALNLTYCIGGFSASQRALVVAAMNEAAAAWEAVAQVDFRDVTSNVKCDKRTPGTVFNVRGVKGGQYLARAFFPSYRRDFRELLIDQSAFGQIAPYTLAGILRHELGHALGFRHEHTRPEAGTCFENSSWRGLTAYDPGSVMHYPQCNGTNKGDLVLTSLDGQGAAALYGPR